MAEFEISPEPSKEDEFEYPKYSDRGDIIVEILGLDEHKVYKWAVDRYSCGAGSTMYINEGMGVEYFVELYGDENIITGPGIYTFVGVHGCYIRGEWGFTDDDEEWEFDELRLATPEEIAEL